MSKAFYGILLAAAFYAGGVRWDRLKAQWIEFSARHTQVVAQSE